MRRTSAGTDRLARGIALLLTLIAVACLVAAWLVHHRTEQQRAAVADRVPTTLITSSSTASSPAGATTPAPRPHPTSSTDATATAQTPTNIVEAIVPKHLFIPGIDVNTTVAAKPTQQTNDPFLGKKVASFGVPDDMYTTTWWSSGPRTGAVGMAVILGHTQINGYGVFNRLGQLKAGQVVGVTRGAHTLKFAVLAVHTGISKKDPTALTSTLTHHPADARLALLTCSGTFNGGYRESEQNTVVFARLVSAT